LLAITTDFKAISHGLVAGEGTVGKLLTSNVLYDQLDAVAVSLLHTSEKASQATGSLARFSAGLNKPGTLANDLTTDTIVFQAISSTAMQLQHIADSAAGVVAQLKLATENRQSTVGVLLHDEATGAQLKTTLATLARSADVLETDLEALQHTFLLRGFFRKQEVKKAAGPEKK
jgi:phospholipid/cholesterol/gamma-HCH transport system substrate-binding protein